MTYIIRCVELFLGLCRVLVLEVEGRSNYMKVYTYKNKKLPNFAGAQNSLLTVTLS